MRFTLSKLFLAVALAALACAGMASHTRWWADSILSLTIFLYVIVALLAVAQAGASRKLRFTFSAVGCSYLLLSLCTLFAPVRELVVTNIPLGLAAKWLNLQGLPTTLTLPTAAAPQIGGSGRMGTGTVTVNSGTLNLSGVNVLTTGSTNFTPVTFGEPELYTLVTLGVNGGHATPIGVFFIIGHCVWSWLFALLAAWFVGFASARHAKRQMT